ncbi:Hypothetical predicted protein [Octopus vulgaris]|uniref:Uncharacterized protein n=1 Tax=Octopus vulgaris TaxID=6645 RepID=A0AA36F9Y7_OCTVU|nr:Hypothetical predicted protein [Octopus vulgaris]
MHGWIDGQSESQKDKQTDRGPYISYQRHLQIAGLKHMDPLNGVQKLPHSAVDSRIMLTLMVLKITMEFPWLLQAHTGIGKVTASKCPIQSMPG